MRQDTSSFPCLHVSSLIMNRFTNLVTIQPLRLSLDQGAILSNAERRIKNDECIKTMVADLLLWIWENILHSELRERFMQMKL